MQLLDDMFVILKTKKMKIFCHC